MQRYNDNELVYLYRQGCEEAFEELLNKYQKIIRHMVNQNVQYYAYGLSNSEDLYQQLLVTFYRQIDAYREDQNKMFSSFMYMVLERRLYSLTRDHHSKRYYFEKEMISLDEPITNKSSQYAMMISEVIADYHYEFQPEYQLHVREGMNKLSELLEQNTTDFERDVFERMCLGYTPTDIAKELKCTIRSVRNAIYRVNHKIKVKKP